MPGDIPGGFISGEHLFDHAPQIGGLGIFGNALRFEAPGIAPRKAPEVFS